LIILHNKEAPRVKNSNPIKVLIIDDDKAVGETLKLVLEPHYFEISEAITGSDGIYAAKEFNPDVIILDLLMPDMDSWRVTKAIRAFCFAPILVLSAVSKPDMVIKALNEGADEFLTKPIPSNVLVAHLNRLARRARAEVSSNI
jgi:two-component system, OmpR family, KDP operon response regulator KdpE